MTTEAITPLRQRMIEGTNSPRKLMASSGLCKFDIHHHAHFSAKESIREAKCVYILGYGFDENNNTRLGLSKSLHEKNKCVLFTNSNNSNRINKSASRVLFNNPNQFFTLSVHGHQMEGYYFEKSVRDTYEALELDFDALEEQLISTSKI
jgi:hypothetical protein